MKNYKRDLILISLSVFLFPFAKAIFLFFYAYFDSTQLTFSQASKIFVEHYPLNSLYIDPLMVLPFILAFAFIDSLQTNLKYLTLFGCIGFTLNHTYWGIQEIQL